ncbi:MAG: hypothetical protein AB7R67_18865 [Vicinamibacterales bacterium]
MTPPTWWQDPKHPIWTIAQVATVTVAALVLSYANATKFDGGEITTALGTGAAAWFAARMRGA